MRLPLCSLLGAMLCVSAQAAESSPKDRTLLIYDTLAKPFSAMNEVEPIALVLTGFKTEVVKKEAAQITPADIENSNRIILAGVSGIPKLDPASQRLIEKTSKPFLGIGRAANLAGDSEIKSKPLNKADVSYRGAKWEVRLDPFYPEPPKGAQILAEAISESGKWPLAWRAGNRFGFGTLPGNQALSMILSDILSDFFGNAEKGRSGLFFIIQNYHPGSDPTALRRLADYMAFNELPFIVTTQLRDVPSDVTQLMPRETYLDSLRYAQSRGGKIFLRGEIGAQDVENYTLDGVYPVGGENPAIAMPAAFADPIPFTVFLGNRIYQSMPGSEYVPFRSHSLLFLPNGGILLPPNILGGLDGDALESVKKSIRELKPLRNSVAGVIVPAWLPFQKMRDVVDAARSCGMPMIPAQTLSSNPSASEHK